MAGSPTVQRRQTNRIKRQLKSFHYECIHKSIVQSDFVRILCRLDIISYKASAPFDAEHRRLAACYESYRRKLLSIRDEFVIRHGRKYATWIQLTPEQAKKQQDRRDRRFMALMRYYGATSN